MPGSLLHENLRSQDVLHHLPVQLLGQSSGSYLLRAWQSNRLILYVSLSTVVSFSKLISYVDCTIIITLKLQSHRGKDLDVADLSIQPLKTSVRQLVVRGCRKVFWSRQKVANGCYRLWSAGDFCNRIGNLLPTKLVGRRFSWSLIRRPIIGDRTRTGCRSVSDGQRH